MPILLLIRHGENDYTRKHRLAGQLPNVHLNERGQAQARALAEALKEVPLRAVYSSPLERAAETAAPIAELHSLQVIAEAGLIETDVGRWQGRSLAALNLTKHWRVVQHAPSRAQFPQGETFYQCQSRVVNSLDTLLARHKSQEVIACVFHSDPIKLAIAHYLGLPLDHFQRLGCDTGSVSAIAVGEMGAQLMWLNRRPPFELKFPPKKK
ncbi:MAG TPA: histidine phosphatase family protein [Anaerolineales bacterium]|nr:histidine phosphatase family protein [Anaerolineales bacterium]